MEYGKNISPLNETFKCNPLSIYGRAKFLASKFLIQKYKENKFPTIVLRLFQAYGPNQDVNRLIPIIIVGCLKNEKIACSPGEQLRDFVYIDDVIRAIFLSLKSKKALGKIINIGFGRPKKVKNIIHMIKDMIGKGRPEFGKIKMRKDEIKALYPCLRQAKKILKWKPKEKLNDGLKKQLDIMQKLQVNFNSGPLISVIMNCYNGDKYLEKSINSLISQTYQNWELIFWDNNSKDKSKDIFKKFQDRRLKYYHNNETTTLYKARNLAIEKSEGELLTFLDVDDYWLPERLKFQVDFFLKFPDINFVYGNYYILNEKLKIKKIAFKKKDLITGKIYNSLVEKYYVGLVSICFRKKIFEKFDERFEIIGDFDFTLKLSKYNVFGVIHEPLSYYRFHEKNFSC